MFVRKSSADSIGTRKDSLELIRHDCPVIPSPLLRRAIPDKNARAAVQLEYLAPSSFTLIPNSYYDKIRVKCLNTLLRHIQTDPDPYDVCLLENFICCEILHRMDAIYGNEGLTVIARLTNGMFIQPSALGRDYLKDAEESDE